MDNLEKEQQSLEAEIGPKMRQSITPIDPAFANRLEQKLLRTHASALSMNNKQSTMNHLFSWSTPFMRKFTLLATPALVFAIILGVIFNPFAASFNSQDFLTKAYASLDDNAPTGNIHYQKTQYLVGQDQADYDAIQREIMEAQIRADMEKYNPGETVDESMFNINMGVPTDTQTEIWQDELGNFLYVTTDLKTGELISSHMTRTDDDGQVRAYFNESPMIEGMGASIQTLSVESTEAMPAVVGEATLPAFNVAVGGAGIMSATPVAGSVTSGSGSIMVSQGGPADMTLSAVGTAGLTASSGMVSVSATADPLGEQPIPTMSICVAEGAIYSPTDSQELYEQLDQLHKASSEDTTRAILESLKTNENVQYQAAVEEDGKRYQVFSVVVPTPGVPEADFALVLAESNTTRLYFDDNTYRLAKEVQIATLDGKDYELGTTIFVEDSYINADVERIFDPSQFDLQPAYATPTGTFELINIDAMEMPSEPGCYTLGEDGKTWEVDADATNELVQPAS